MIIQNEKCEVKRACISKVCCYILTGTKLSKMSTKKVKNPANKRHGKWEEVEVTLLLNISLSMTLNATWTAGYMDTLHMHIHMTEVMNQNDKGTDLKTVWEEWTTGCWWWWRQQSRGKNESGGWGIDRTTVVKDFYYFCGKRQEKPLMGEGGHGKVSIETVLN